MIRLFHLLLITAFSLPGVGFAASPYAGEQSRSIKALSDQEVADYVQGKGMGLAKAAELNGYPGPAHVLELAAELDLSALQKEKTEQVFKQMQARASAIGARLVDEERRLDGLFASKSISREVLAESLQAIGVMQGEIRRAHLEAHLQQSEILTQAQAMKYWHLRGYAESGARPHHRH